MNKNGEKIIFKSMFGVCNICICIASVSMNNGTAHKTVEPYAHATSN